ncbi:N-acetylmuramoyl-L-alanine amidase [Romboutsia sp.]|uniref:N-acetylmuramoyl-L-alanine amidase n=1 Tax=Romboutsia sp. TaxID=1965302 RepID=UPI002BAD748D|nr:N-acetylmuramoyl-L-alanine amidase [Romboutsia sp.]HSQ90164.1 N-acetylmuramoyl-L-alanine amidase [Romboutsia sp.]
MALAKRKLRIHISAGHTLEGKGTGSEGYINESKENRILAKKVVAILKTQGHYVTYGEVDKSASYLKEQVTLANKEDYDVVVQIHFNAFKDTSKEMGTEVWYCSDRGIKYAKNVCDELKTLYYDRGVKKQPNFYWLKNTKSPAILIETCFVDSKADTDKYKANIDKTATLIAQGIMGEKIKVETPKPKPPVNNTKHPKYVVIAGTYHERDYANNQINKLRKLGIDCYIDVK